MTASNEQAQEISQGIREADLPSSMQFVSDLIGLEPTLKLLQVYGGRNVYIPKKARDNHPIARIAGREALEKLAAEFGGLALQFPMAAWAQSKARNRVIRAKRTSASGSELARDFKLSERQIWKILGKSDVD